MLTLYTIPCLQADSATYQAEKQLKEFGDKVPAEVKSKVEEKIKALREASEQDNLEGMKSGMEALQQEMMTVGQAVYSQVGADVSMVLDLSPCLHQQRHVGPAAGVVWAGSQARHWLHLGTGRCFRCFAFAYAQIGNCWLGMPFPGEH